MRASERERDQSALESLYALEGKARLDRIECLIGAFVRGPARILVASLEEHKALSDCIHTKKQNKPDDRIQQALDILEWAVRENVLDSLTRKDMESLDG